MKTLKQLAQEAIDIQDASNMLGLSKSFAEAVHAVAYNLRKEGKASTTNINNHPIIQLWADKLRDLSGMGNNAAGYTLAYEEVQAIAHSKE